MSAQADTTEEAKVIALANLTVAPVIRDEMGRETTIGPGGRKTIYYDGLEYEGKPTRIYAWIGIPEEASSDNRVPGVVLAHGGGGTAFEEWVEKWKVRGYAAISMGLEGQIEEREPPEPGEVRGKWKKHAWPGPERDGIFGDSDKLLEDQWIYHAVADVILANSLLRSLPQVDSDRVGLMGISWGGIVTSKVIGIDHRFAFAIPTYGCGNLSQAPNQYGKALGSNRVYTEVWDPILRLKKVEMPTLWLSWPNDKHFPLDIQASCYLEVAGPYMVSLIPDMRHGHQLGWNPPDSYAFAESIVKDGKPWSRQVSSTLDSGQITVVFESSKTLTEAYLVSTKDTGITGDREWIKTQATLHQTDGQWLATALIPDGSTACFMNAMSDDLTVSSNYLEITTSNGG